LVEANGDYWHSSEKAQERDARKAAWAKGNGYRLVTIWEHEIKTEGARVLVTGRVIPALEIRQ
jgi:very-short-patch-repair endonuclease